jgi:tight adherence protein C
VPFDGFSLALGSLVTVALASGAAALVTWRGRAAGAARLLRVDPSDPVSALTLRPIAVGADPAEPEAKTRLRRQLVQAGFRKPSAPEVFIAAKGLLAVAGLAVVILVHATRVEPVQNAPEIALLATAAGFFLPNLWLRARRADRLRDIQRGLPDALDLLVTCVEAGLGLDAAMQRVADEIALAFKVLSAELRLASLEVKAGIPRIEALRRLAERTGSEELRGLAATLAQTEIFGTSVGAALRIQAESIRIRRMQRAEEKAAYISVKMTFPLVVCILPSLFVVVAGPAIVQIAETLLPTLNGR